MDVCVHACICMCMRVCLQEHACAQGLQDCVCSCVRVHFFVYIL